MATVPAFDIPAAREHIRLIIDQHDPRFYDLFLQTSKLLESLSNDPVTTREEIESASWFGVIGKSFYLNTDAVWDNLIFGLRYIGFGVQIPRAKAQQYRAFAKEVRIWSLHLSTGLAALIAEINPTIRETQPSAGEVTRFFTLTLNSVREGKWSEAGHNAKQLLKVIERIMIALQLAQFDVQDSERIKELLAENLQLVQATATLRKERSDLQQVLGDAAGVIGKLRFQLGQVKLEIGRLERESWTVKLRRQFREQIAKVIKQRFVVPFKKLTRRFPYRVPGAREN